MTAGDGVAMVCPIGRQHCRAAQAHRRPRRSTCCRSKAMLRRLARKKMSPNAPATGTALSLLVRGKLLPAQVVPLPFVPHNYVKEAAR